MLVPGLDPTDVDVRLPPPLPRLRHCLSCQLHRHLLPRLQVYSSFPSVIPLSTSPAGSLSYSKSFRDNPLSDRVVNLTCPIRKELFAGRSPSVRWWPSLAFVSLSSSHSPLLAASLAGTSQVMTSTQNNDLSTFSPFQAPPIIPVGSTLCLDRSPRRNGSWSPG